MTNNLKLQLWDNSTTHLQKTHQQYETTAHQMQEIISWQAETEETEIKFS